MAPRRPASGRDRTIAVAAVVVLVAVAVALIVWRAGDDDAGSASATPPPTAPATTAATAPALPDAAPAVSLPARIPGYSVAAVGLRSYRLSLVFRLKNAILNGVGGHASDYSITTATARREGRTALLIGVAAVRGAQPPDIRQDLARLIGIAPSARGRADGVPYRLVRGPEYSLGTVEAGPRRAVVAIATTPAQALALTRATARGIAAEQR